MSKLLMDLNEDCLLEIFEYLHLKDIIRVSETTSQFDETISRKLQLGTEFFANAFTSITSLLNFLKKFSSKITRVKIDSKPIYFEGTNEDFQNFLANQINENSITSLDIALESGTSIETLTFLSWKFHKVQHFTIRLLEERKIEAEVKVVKNETTNNDSAIDAKNNPSEAGESGEVIKTIIKIETEIVGEASNVNSNQVQQKTDGSEVKISGEQSAEVVQVEVVEENNEIREPANENNIADNNESESESDDEDNVEMERWHHRNDYPLEKETNELLSMAIQLKFDRIERLSLIKCKTPVHNPMSFRQTIAEIGENLIEFNVVKSPFCELDACFCRWPIFYTRILAKYAPNLVSLNLSMWAGCGMTYPHRGSLYRSLKHLRNLKILTVSISVLCYCTDFRNFVHYIPNVTDLTITRRKAWHWYRIPEEIVLESIGILEELDSLKSLRLEFMAEKEASSISIIQERLPHLQKLHLISCSFVITEKQILDYIEVAENLIILSLTDTEVKCADSNKFYQNILDIVTQRMSKVPLTIYGWKEKEKPNMTSSWLKILSN